MIEDKNDKKIKDFLENNYPMKAINVDFKDLNNMNLIINSSFKNAYDYIIKNNNYDNWFYIAEFDPTKEGPIVASLINMTLSKDGFLNLYWIEQNRVLNDKNYFKLTLEYLKGYVHYHHFKGIKFIIDDKFYKDYINFKLNDLKECEFNKQEGNLSYIWKS